MNLERAVRLLGERGYAIMRDIHMPQSPRWLVLENDYDGWMDVGVGDTWRTAYADALHTLRHERARQFARDRELAEKRKTHVWIEHKVTRQVPMGSVITGGGTSYVQTVGEWLPKKEGS